LSRAESVAPTSSADHSTRSTNVAGIPPSLASLGKKLSGGFTNKNDDNSSLDQNYSGYSKMDTTMGSKRNEIFNDLSMNGSFVDETHLRNNDGPGTSSPGPGASLFKQSSISKMMGLGKNSSSLTAAPVPYKVHVSK